MLKIQYNQFCHFDQHQSYQIIQIGDKYSNDENVLEKIAMLFIEMLSISSYYDYIEDIFLNIMKFAFGIFEKYKESNERLALFGLEIICCIGDEEVSRVNNNYIMINKLDNNMYSIDKRSKGYFNKISTDLQNLIEKNVKLSEDEEEEDMWNISKACLHIPPEIKEGEIVTIIFREENDSHARNISITNENVLITAIDKFKYTCGKIGRIKKAIYERDNITLNLNTKIRNLNIDLSSNIIVYLERK